MRHIGVFSFMFANGRSEFSAAVPEAPVILGGASLTVANSDSETKDEVASFTVCDTVNCKLSCTGNCEASPLLCRLGPWP